MAILSNLTKRCVLCKFRLRIGRIVNEKLKIGVWIIFFCLKIQNIKFKILNGRTVHGPAYHLKFGFLLFFFVDKRLELENRANGKEIFQTFRSKQKKRSTSAGGPQFANGFFGKLLFHLTFNRNFRIFLFRFLETKRYCFGFDVNYLHSWGYYPMRRTLVTKMSTRCSKGKQYCKNIFFSNIKNY